VDKNEILSWLREEDEAALATLWEHADATRKAHVGDEVHLRGLVEISNHCARLCGYCGIRAPARIQRYRMTPDEILESARKAVRLGYGTLVLQAGEDPALTGPWVTELVRRVRAETPLAVTLSLGERDPEELAAWREAGADRYLLRFETSNEALFERIHPPRKGAPAIHRVEQLRQLRSLGYEVGSGVMIGIPGQSYADLAHDIELFAELDLDMIGVGPFIPDPNTPLGAGTPGPDQVPNTEEMTYKVVALTRLVCPSANIPSTTALATINTVNGRELGLARGANVVMPNVTPVAYRSLYAIYPGKACINETAEMCAGCLRGRIERMGRKVGTGRGDSPNVRGRAGH
jgi:biotin synthase